MGVDSGPAVEGGGVMLGNLNTATHEVAARSQLTRTHRFSQMDGVAMRTRACVGLVKRMVDM